MIKLRLCMGFLLVLVFFPLQVIPANEDVRIMFLAPFNSPNVMGYPETSFSVPSPVVILDPLVFGDPAEHPGKCVLQRKGPSEYYARLSGTVYDFIADMVPEGEADIKEVKIGGFHGPAAKASVRRLSPAEIETLPLNEYSAELTKAPPQLGWVRPFAFVGRFETEILTIPIQSGYVGIHAEAVNVNHKSGFSKLDIKGVVNRDERRYDIEAEVEHQIDYGLVNPVLVYIEDPSITKENVDQAFAKINGVRVGLRFMDGQLQLDRPIMGINGVPPEGIPNLIQVTGDPDHFIIEYGHIKTNFGWSYTR